MPARSTTASRTVMFLAVALLLGFAAGRFSSGGPGARAATEVAGDADAAATATRSAELIELDQLRTQVAATQPPVVCTPAATSTPEPSPTPTPSPTVVPPAAAGQPIPYPDGWTVTVVDVALLSNFAGLTPQGVFAKVSLTITNNGETERPFPYDELRIRDAQERPFVTPNGVITRSEAGWFNLFPPSLPTDGLVIFDIATDAQGPFILESTADPTFRVQIELQQRG